jgi:hypothetical protein
MLEYWVLLVKFLTLIRHCEDHKNVCKDVNFEAKEMD